MPIIKMMSDEDLPDHNPSKRYELVFVTEDAFIEMLRADENDPVAAGAPIIRISYPEDQGSGTNWYPSGNTYIMNDQGKTVSSFTYSEYGITNKVQVNVNPTLKQRPPAARSGKLSSCHHERLAEQIKDGIGLLDYPAKR